jgi:hypothetical protein
MITDDQYLKWLQHPNPRRMVLVEAHYQGGIEYIGSGPFISKPTDTPSHKVYEELLTGSIETTGAIDRALSFGSIDLVNDGALDSWLSRAWEGHSLKVYLGDALWPRDDFRLVIDGINGGIAQSGMIGITFNFYDRMKRLDGPVQSELLSTGQPKPICLGHVFNCVPVLIDAPTLKYQVNNGPVESIVVRDNGVDITGNTTLDLNEGTFMLGAARVGKITCDVEQADKTLAKMVKFVADQYQESVDVANLAAFPNTDTLGYYLRSSASGSQVLLELAKSVGGFVRFSLLADLQIVRLDLSGAVALYIDSDDVLKNGLELDSVDPPATSINLSYRKNWGVQDADSQAGSVSAENRELYSREFTVLESPNLLVGFPHAEPRDVETLISSPAAAQAECNRRALLRKEPRQIWRLSGFLSASQVFIGDLVELTFPEFGFQNGRTGAIISTRKSLLNDSVELEIFI